MAEKKKAKDPADKKKKLEDLSLRDRNLVLVDKLLAEQHLMLEPAADDAQLKAEPVNLDEAVEIAKLPPKEPPQPKEKAPEAAPPQPSPAQSKAPAADEKTPPRPNNSGKKSGGLVIKLVLALLVLLFLILAFLAGLMGGRGHILADGPVKDLTTWVEQTLGFVPKPPAAKPAPTADDPAQDEGPTAGEATEETGEAGRPAEEPPVWDWEAWPAPPADAESADPADEAAAADAAETDAAAAAPDDSAEAVPADSAPAAQAQNDPADNAAEPAAEADDDTQWPAAVEETTDQPQAANDAVDYEAMLEAADVPDASLSEAAALPPSSSELSGTGKYAVQVALAFNKAEAEDRAERLKGQGFKAYYYPNANGRYPVKVGRFDTRQDADAAKVKLEELGYESPTVSVLAGGK